MPRKEMENRCKILIPVRTGTIPWILRLISEIITSIIWNIKEGWDYSVQIWNTKYNFYCKLYASTVNYTVNDLCLQSLA